jgi:hypothetical protein
MCCIYNIKQHPIWDKNQVTIERWYVKSHSETDISKYKFSNIAFTAYN